jgi:peptidoglycan/xylan/chitin deacetylase (PgdA/CDA1 family)
MYHGVIASPLAVPDWCFLDAARFADQIRHLAEHYEIVRLTDIPRVVRSTSKARSAIAITFDDGFMNNCEVAWPILQRARVPATIFLVTGLIGTSSTTWSCRLHSAIERTDQPDLHWNGGHFELVSEAGKAHASKSLQAALKQLPSQRLHGELRRIVAALGGDTDEPLPRSSPYRMLDWEAVRSMVATNLVDVGAHSVSHAILSLLSPVEQRLEIERSVRRIEEATGTRCLSFSYPNGRRSDYDAGTIDILKDLGIAVAVSTEEGDNDAGVDQLQLRRYGVGNDWDFAHLLEGL